MMNLKATDLAYIVEQRTARHARMEKKHADMMQEILQHIMHHGVPRKRMARIGISADAQNNITKENKGY